MLSGHCCRLNREFGFTLDDEAVEALSNQDSDHLGHGPDDPRLGLVGIVKGREQSVLKDRIRIQDQDSNFHKKAGIRGLQSRNLALSSRWQSTANAPRCVSAVAPERRSARPRTLCGNVPWQFAKAFPRHAYPRSR